MDALERLPHINMPQPGGNGPIRSTNEAGRARVIAPDRTGHVVSRSATGVLIQMDTGYRLYGQDDFGDLKAGDRVAFDLAAAPGSGLRVAWNLRPMP
jgi:hypothetical protein